MKPVQRQRLIWAGLMITLATTLWTALHDEEADSVQVAAAQPRVVVPQTTRAQAGSVKHSDTPMLDMRQLQRTPWQDSEHNLFSHAQIVAQAELPEQPIVQQAMEIPPVPFTYAGKLEDHGQYTVFLSMGDKNMSVKTGDTVGDWKVKEIDATRMILSYQPLRADVPLLIGEHH